MLSIRATPSVIQAKATSKDSQVHSVVGVTNRIQAAIFLSCDYINLGLSVSQKPS